MYVEERMYTLHPGTAPEYLNYYQTLRAPGPARALPRIMKCAPFFVDRLKRMLAAVK